MVNSTDDTDDQTYSIEFLDHEWRGAGFGFNLACVFDEKRVTPTAFTGFVSTLRTNYRLKEVVFTTYDDSDDPINVIMEEQEIYETDAWLDPCRTAIPDAASVSIQDNVDPNNWFVLYFYAPNYFEYGADTNFLYLGSRKEDRRRIKHFVSVALRARKFFGDGAGVFGDESYVSKFDLDKKLATPNLTADSGDHWINEILNRSEQWRPKNEGEFQKYEDMKISQPAGRLVQITVAPEGVGQRWLRWWFRVFGQRGLFWWFRIFRR